MQRGKEGYAIVAVKSKLYLFGSEHQTGTFILEEDADQTDEGASSLSLVKTVYTVEYDSSYGGTSRVAKDIIYAFSVDNSDQVWRFTKSAQDWKFI